MNQIEWPSELGVTQAARLAGIPEVTLRLHVDQGKVLGVRRTAHGRRLISRQGLLAYLQARGLDNPRREPFGEAEVQAQVRLPWGLARFERLRGRILTVGGIPWSGPLPDPEAPVAFRIEGGSLDGAEGEARVSWILWKDGHLEAGLRSEREL